MRLTRSGARTSVVGAKMDSAGGNQRGDFVFQLRDEHVRGMQQVAEDNFVGRAVQHLRQTFPNTTAPQPDGDLSERVRRGIARAKPYGLTSEKQVMCFLDSGMILGETFDTNPDHAWAHAILISDKPADFRARTVLSRSVELAHQAQPGTSGE